MFRIFCTRGGLSRIFAGLGFGGFRLGLFWGLLFYMELFGVHDFLRFSSQGFDLDQGCQAVPTLNEAERETRPKHDKNQLSSLALRVKHTVRASV